MNLALTIVGGLIAFAGAVWFLQGINVLTAGNSPMIGDIRWSYYGGIAIVIGLALVLLGRRRRP
jgi:hypothetical protein